MKLLKKYLFILGVILLAGCSAKYEKYYTYEFPPSEDGKQCIQQCMKTKDRCLSLCTNDQDLCHKNSWLQADKEYQRYVKERQLVGRSINRDMNSFYDPLQCSKVSCDCESDYRACYRMCGGVVKVGKRCVAHCSD
jgi:hypothetical protein